MEDETGFVEGVEIRDGAEEAAKKNGADHGDEEKVEDENEGDEAKFE